MVLREASFAEDLQAEIATACAAGPWRLGWRLLYSPVRVLDRANVAFIGLNPGGEAETEGHAAFAMPSGIAYLSESWGGAPPREARLQRQVRQLAQLLGVAPEEMLAGNLIPFRSPDFRRLPDREEAVRFGSGLWVRILRRVRPRLVVTMGGLTEKVIAQILNGRLAEAVPSGWGNVQLRRWTGDADLVALPHLSRYALFSRADCREPLHRVFGGKLTARRAD